MLRSQRPKENPDRVRIRRGQVRPERRGDVTAAVEKFQRVETAARVVRESTD
jgi:hypothetical protein